MSDSSYGNADVPVEPGKIFVGGIAWETQEENLKKYFSKFGEVSDCIVMRKPPTDPSHPPDSQRHRGFGFVTFKEPSTIETILNQQSPHTLDGKKIEPKRATVKTAVNQIPSNQELAVKKIFVGGIAHGTSEDEITAYFSQFGNVTEVDLKYDKSTQRMRGFGFVGFDCEDPVEKVVQIHFHQIKGKTVETKKAEPRHSSGPKQPYPNTMGGAYHQPQAYSTDYRTGATNGQYSHQYYGQSATSAAYPYYTAPQGSMHPTGTAAYSNYPSYTANQFGTTAAAYPSYEPGTSFQRSQGSTGAESRGDPAYPSYTFNTGGQMASYQESTGGYPSSRSGYGTGVDSYGQQSTGYSAGEYSRGSSSQRQQQQYSSGRAFGH